MAEHIDPGAWVEIRSQVLEPSQRAPHLPEDTKRVPLEMRVKGHLVVPAALGEEVEILTPSGRRLRGTLQSVNPPYTHGFGAPFPELSCIASEVRALLRARRRAR
jgi:2-amino-4-ketopentanoate thiolase alpha subunit